MATHEKPAGRGRRRATRQRVAIGRDLHDGRVDRALALADVGAAVDLSATQVSRIERGLVPGVSLETLTVIAEVVGLELSARTYAGAGPLRDRAQLRLLEAFRARLHSTVGWATEVPLPIPGDQRAWDGLVSVAGRRYGVEAETAPRDAQALVRRLQLKVRDGGVDGVILVVSTSRAAVDFAAGAKPALAPMLPIPGSRALELLGVGVDPGGSSLISIAIPSRRRIPRRSGASAPPTV
jgi:transcriptional regulator with XRE-family HTH domain